MLHSFFFFFYFSEFSSFPLLFSWHCLGFGKQWPELNVGLHYLLIPNWNLQPCGYILGPGELWGAASWRFYHIQKPEVVERHRLCSQRELESILVLSLACWMIFRSHLISLSPSKFLLVNRNNICGGLWKCTSQIAGCGEHSWQKAPTAMFCNLSSDLCQGHASHRLLPTHDWAR